MHYALLATTALGAIGLYLMLPRERAPLARLGLLLGVLALAGFFLYLVRTMALGAAGDLKLSGAASGPPIYFYLFAIIMIAGAVGVVCQPKPVYAALYFVMVTLAGAGIFVLLMAEFMAIVLIIIYAGAILVTYVFVIMLASQSSSGNAGAQVRSPSYDRRASEPFIAVLVSFVLVGAILQVLFPVNGRTLAEPSGRVDVLMARNLDEPIPGADTQNYIEPASLASTTQPGSLTAPTNVQVLGANLYSRYSFTLELAGIILTIALVGAVVIARKNVESGSQSLGSGKLPNE